MSGSIEVVIGPNGYGKSTYLEQKRDGLLSNGIDASDILYMPSEIKLMDEVKDSLDNSQTMEFLMSEMLETPDYLRLRDELYHELDAAISNNVEKLNLILDEVLSLNGSTRSGDFISSNPKRAIKYPVAINQKDIKNKMGSGQRMQLLLMFARDSKKHYIILDEPEKYSHPSLLNGTAKAINDLVASGKDVILATHSPKLVSMLELNYCSIRIINDATHNPKSIDFDGAVKSAKQFIKPGSLPNQNKHYYKDGDSFRDCLERRHNRPFIESLFSKHVYLCEGVNDEIFINEALRTFGGFYDDYSIVKVWGKYNLPVFISLYRLIGIPISVVFDVDDEGKPLNKMSNEAIRKLSGTSKVVELDPNLETVMGYKGAGNKGDTLNFMDYLEGIAIPVQYDPRLLEFFDNVTPSGPRWRHLRILLNRSCRSFWLSTSSAFLCSRTPQRTHA